MQVLDDTSPKVQGIMAQYLEDIHDSRSIDPLKLTLYDPDYHVQYCAWVSLKNRDSTGLKPRGILFGRTLQKFERAIEY